MKKIININLSGRLIPMEDTAYDKLKAYLESLNRHFAHEEGRGEIMSDIESRIAEILQEKIRKGAHCITDEDLEGVIALMGRPEEFDDEPSTEGQAANASDSGNNSSQTGSQQQTGFKTGTKRLYRNGNDKILGGVCSGIANYFNIDPAIIRIIFAVCLFAGFGFILYILMWMFIPSSSAMESNISKRLYRNPERKVLGGVCSGLAAYFNIELWIPRAIFAAPFILSLIFGIAHRGWWFDFDFFPFFISGSFTSTMFVAYIILWIVLPEAHTTYDKMNMRGEKIDVNTIKNTVKGELETFKTRAEQMGDELKTRAKEWGEEVKDRAQSLGNEMKGFAQSRSSAIAGEAAPIARNVSEGFGHVIGVVFKAFFLFIAGVILFSLIVGLIALFGSGFDILSFKNYLVEGGLENFLLWATLLLFICLPIVGILLWIIRRIAGVRSGNKYLGYTFGILWVLGWIFASWFAATVGNNFSRKGWVEEKVALTQPVNGKLIIDVERPRRFSGDDWSDFDDAMSVSADSIFLSSVRVSVIKSQDNEYHAELVKFSRGSNANVAAGLAERISYPVSQKDSLLLMPDGFSIYRGTKFRNQQVMLVIHVPVGKKIRIDHSVNGFNWFSVGYNRRGRNWNYNDMYDGDEGGFARWETDEDMVMTAAGNLEPVNKKPGSRRNENNNDVNNDENQNNNENRNDPQYRYPDNRNNNRSDSLKPADPQKDTGNIRPARQAQISLPDQPREDHAIPEEEPVENKNFSHLYPFTGMLVQNSLTAAQ